MIKYTLTIHAKEEILKRGISLDIIEETLISPLLVNEEPNNRKSYQKVFKSSNEKKYLIRVIVEVKNKELMVITAYRTSKINKYIKEAQ